MFMFSDDEYYADSCSEYYEELIKYMMLMMMGFIEKMRMSMMLSLLTTMMTRKHLKGSIT